MRAWTPARALHPCTASPARAASSRGLHNSSILFSCWVVCNTHGLSFPKWTLLQVLQVMLHNSGHSYVSFCEILVAELFDISMWRQGAWMAVTHLLISFASGVDVRELTKLSSDLSSVLPTAPFVSTTVTSRLPTSCTHLMSASASSADDVSSGSHFQCITP